MDRHEFQVRARFRHSLKRARVPDGASLLLAVSGGCDSVALLHLCLAEADQRRWSIHVAHIDHSLRDDSLEHADHVRTLARTASVPYHGLRVRRDFWVRHRGESIEALARGIRRRGLRRLARAAGAGRIVLAHTLDDQAETVVLNILRGSGIRGLGGMAAVRPPWLRPLLDIRRQDLRRLATKSRWEWLEDPTNEDPRFLRNRIRHQLLPLLEADFQPGAARVLARTAASLRPLRRYLKGLADQAWPEILIDQDAGRIRLEPTKLATYDRVVIEEILWRAYGLLRGSPRDLKRAHLVALVRAIRTKGQGTFFLPAGIEAILNRQALSLRHPIAR